MNVSDIPYLGLDIGGAHLKIVGLDKNKKIRIVSQHKTPVWESILRLNKSLDFLNNFNNKTLCAITMTAELCDNFKTRKNGVNKIANLLKGLSLQKFFFTNEKQIFTQNPKSSTTASMNWYATGKFISTMISEALIIDFGSTTTDLILIKNNTVKNKFFDDFTRLTNHELVYTGFTRTSLAGLSNEIEIKNKNYQVIPEFFSRTSDLYNVKELMKNNMDLYPTCDGGGRTKKDSLRRIARNFGFDLNNSNEKFVKTICEKLIFCQLNKIFTAAELLLKRNNCSTKITLIPCGIGKTALINFAKNKYRIKNFEDLITGNSSKKKLASYHAPATACAFLISDLNL
ncbi:MAG: hypothetical protein CMM91_03920 [Rickettsiales bacterium]|nr:hypothetical protein [Rickettsiales bacterium]OUV54191.1 MAG: hypothetical protein CBC87_02665 [Rickettsiales bacterium TMED127]|tara:strand:+ start:32484 stop:33512 length:1029 start_codon:yes stop_codon:yes gene_type:complete